MQTHIHTWITVQLHRVPDRPPCVHSLHDTHTAAAAVIPDSYASQFTLRMGPAAVACMLGDSPSFAEFTFVFAGTLQASAVVLCLRAMATK